MMDGLETVLTFYAIAILFVGVFLGWLLFG